MATFTDATRVTRGDGNRHRAVLDSDWFIWGPFGGYLAAIVLRAMGLSSAHARPATLSCQYLAVGEAGPVDIEVEIRKAGRRAECLEAGLWQGGKLLLRAQSWMVAGNLDGLRHYHGAMPAVAPPSSLRPWDGFDVPERHRPIWKHLERRPDLARAGGRPEWTSWLRLHEHLAADDLVLRAALAAAWIDIAPWNGVLAVYGWPTSHIAPTLDLTIQFGSNLYAPDVIASDWLLVEIATPTAGAGLLGASGRLWSESGKLVAVGAAQALCVPAPRFDGRP